MVIILSVGNIASADNVGLASFRRSPYGSDMASNYIGFGVASILDPNETCRIVAWGYNDYYQCDAPVDDSYVAIAGGYRHSLALKSDGSIVAWGSNDDEQCNVPSGDVFVDISAGCYHSLAIKSDGSIVGWGHNFYKQIDDIPTGKDFVEILGAEHHAVARRSDGSLEAWGKNTLGQTDVPSGDGFTAIAGNWHHHLALKSDGSLAAWGLKDQGQCDVPTGDDYIAIAGGEYHSLALKSDGSLVAWGFDNAGQVSNMPTGNGFVDIAAGASYNYALKSDGSLVAWGQNNWDQCDVPTGNGFVDIVSGHRHGLALIPGLRPVAFAGVNQEAPDFDDDGSEQVTLDGSGSSDGDGAIISWKWEDDLGDTIPDGEITTATLSVGVHTITLTVTDDEGLTDTDTVTVAVVQLPVADAGSGQTVTDIDDDGSEQVTLDGSGSSDSDGAIMSWEWEDDLGDTIPDGETSTAALSAGTHTITLTVTDDDGLTDTDTVTITINNPSMLTVSSTLGGVVLAPGEGQFSYMDGTIVPILAVADSEYRFFGWTGTAVDFGKVTDQREPNTIVTMDGDYTLEAAFTIIGDFTGDSRVNFKDFALFGNWWLLNDPLFDIAPQPDGDDVIDELDLALFSEHWLDLEYIRLYDMPLNTDPNWTLDGEWSFGQPMGNGGGSYGSPDPNSGQTGNNVYGVNLSGDYTVSAGGPYYLTAGPFDCTGYNNILLRFSRWLNTDAPAYAGSKIEASNNRSDWTAVWEHTVSSDIADSNWLPVEYDISSVADNQQTVYIRWSYQINDSHARAYSGWNVDDIELWGNAFNLPEFTLDTDPDWSTEGEWSFGKPNGSGGAYGNPDPNSGYAGNNVYGVNLNGDYSTFKGGPYYLTTGALDCSGYHNIRLQFARWLNSDSPDYIANKIEASNNGTDWSAIWENTDPSDITDAGWQIVEYDMSSIADNQPAVYIRWSYQIVDDRAYQYSGWNIDEIKILGEP